MNNLIKRRWVKFMKKSLGKRLISLAMVLMIISLMLTGCSKTDKTSETEPTKAAEANTATDANTATEENGSETETVAADPFGKMEPAVDVTSMMLEDNIRNVPEGMTMEDNPWIDLFKEYGINIEYAISGSQDDLNTKLNLAISSGDLPDVIQVNAEQFQELSEAGYLTDLTDSYNQYASDDLKAMLNQDGGIMAKNGIVDGKLLGIVQPQGYEDFCGVVSIRTDWLKECGLEAPNTMDDLWNIAKTFKEKNMGGTCTIGIGMTKNVMDLLTPSIGLLNGYHAYSGIWLNQNDSLVYSSIQPEMKTALGQLANYYKEGLIDPEFGSKDSAKLMEDALSGKSGIVVSHFCAPFDLLNGVKSGQEWGFYKVPSADGKMVKAQASVGFSGALCYTGKNPEVLIKMLNIFTKYVAEDPVTYNDNAVRNFAYPTLTAATSDNNKIHNEYVQYINTGVKPEKVTQGYDSTAEAAEKYRNNKDCDGYTMWGVFGPEGTESIVSYQIENDGYMLNAFTGAPTEAIKQYQSILKTSEEQMITYIILGSKPLDYFDQFVEDWKANGGDTITQEVNDWYQKNK
jgi:putative aldouronate transport system substrate-binding protein